MRSACERARPAHVRLLAALACAVVAMLAAPPRIALAQTDLRVVVQSSPLAGFRHHAATLVWPRLALGDRLDLVREPANPHDAAAIRVEWQGHLLGYVPRAENGALAWAIDRGERVEARISKLEDHPNPRRRVEFEVYAR